MLCSVSEEKLRKCCGRQSEQQGSGVQYALLHMKRRRLMKKVNYLIALIIFALTMLLINGSGILISMMAAIGGLMFRGPNGLTDAYNYLMDNLNLYSALTYIPLFVLFGLWYYFAVTEKEGIKQSAARIRQNISPASILWKVIAAFALQHFITIIMTVINAAAPRLMEEYSEMVETSGLAEYSVMWALSTLILPPLTEETIFRGLILRYLRRAGACFIVANLIQAVLFGIFHMNLVQGIYTAFLGFILGYFAKQYNTLAAPMLLHALFNLFGTVVVDLENAFLPDSVLTALVLLSIPLLIFVFLMIHFRVGEKRRQSQIGQEEEV